MIKDEIETNKLIDIREKQKELREKQAEIEEFLKEIEKLNTICFALSGNIKFEREKIDSLKKEIAFRKKHLEEVDKNLNSFLDKNNPNSQFYVDEIKNKIIKEKLTQLLEEKIPELKPNQLNHERNDSDNEFRDLITDHVNLMYIQYDSSQNTPDKTDKQQFRISSKSTFKSLKRIACLYWDIDNDGDYIICDDAEGILYNEDILIDAWLRDYSALANNLKLVSINSLKMRQKLIGNQENRIKENNKFNYKNLKKENFLDINIGNDNSNHKIREFFNEYQGLNPFILIEEKSEDGAEKKIEGAGEQARNIETSFWMLLLLLCFFILTLFF